MNFTITKLPKEKYPHGLHEIPQPPEELFIAGNMPNEETVMLTVVGSRKYSTYGREVCEQLIAGLAGYNIAVVSGLAIGIDTIAHKSALKHGLKTIAIPGSGLNPKTLYPSTNRLLAQKILDHGGALISEFKPDFKATIWSFPQRNRIMAGIAMATLVIEAEEKSGTLITAKMALDYNREVLAVPGSVFSQTSKGTNHLIKQGATPVTSSKDILEAIGLDAKDKLQETGREVVGCSTEEKEILKILQRQPLTKDELIRVLKMSTIQANVLLSGMELKGLVIEHAGELFPAIK